MHSLLYQLKKTYSKQVWFVQTKLCNITSFARILQVKYKLMLQWCYCEVVKKALSFFPEAEELYQKRILTITGICIALLVVGIMCVVAYCKTK